jgi:hypothetical protein
MSLVETWLAPFVIAVVGGLVVEYLSRLRKRSTTTSQPTEHKITTYLSSGAAAAMMLACMLILSTLFFFGSRADNPWGLLVARVFISSLLLFNLLQGYEERSIRLALRLFASTLSIPLFFAILFSSIGALLGLGFEATMDYYIDVSRRAIFHLDG